MIMRNLNKSLYMVSYDRLVTNGYFYFPPRGRFEILSLYGSFLVQEMGGHPTWTSRLSVSLAGPDGRVLGGRVARVLGSFNADISENTTKKQQATPSKPALASPKHMSIARAPISVAMGLSRPPSRGTLSESFGGQGMSNMSCKWAPSV
jgi:hypothetical protein